MGAVGARHVPAVGIGKDGGGDRAAILRHLVVHGIEGEGGGQRAGRKVHGYGDQAVSVGLVRRGPGDVVPGLRQLYVYGQLGPGSGPRPRLSMVSENVRLSGQRKCHLNC